MLKRILKSNRVTFWGVYMPVWALQFLVLRYKAATSRQANPHPAYPDGTPEEQALWRHCSGT